jgi:hypothetical protein
LFDYDKGVKNKKLRRQLARAEKFDEKITVAESILGSGGYTVNSKGTIAATPLGMLRIGEEPEFITLDDGSKMAKNVVVDGSSWFERGDLSDFAGIVGPVAGALFALTPQSKFLTGLRKFTRYIGGSDRLDRIIAAGLGTAAGKGVEEAADAIQGFQLQNREEIKDLLVKEFALGAGGQGIGEAFGLGYSVLLGKKMPFDNLRFYRNSTQGHDLDDLMKLDKSLGREATEAEIKKAVEDGTIRKYMEKGLPSQGAYNRQLPARAQALAEQVLGNTRSDSTKRYLFRMQTELFRKLNKEDVTSEALDDLMKKYQGRSAITPEQKRTLDLQVKDKIDELKRAEADTTQSLTSMLDQMSENITGMGIYGNRVSKTDIGSQIRETIKDAREGIRKSMNRKYISVDNDLRALTNKNIKPKIEEIVLGQTAKARNKVEQVANENVAFDLGLGDADGLLSQPKKGLTDILDGIDKRITSGKFSLRTLRNTVSTLKEVVRNQRGDNEIISAIVRVVDDLEDTFNILGDPKMIQAKLKGSGQLFEGDVKIVARVMEDLKRANKYSAEVLKPFDSLQLKKIRFESARGSYDVDEIYQKVFYEGKSQDLRNVFAALDDYDSYLKGINKAKDATSALTVRNTIKQKLFADALEERRSPGKLKVLFGDEMTAAQFDDLLSDIVQLKPNLKPSALSGLVRTFNQSNKGIVKTQAGKEFLEGVEKLARESAETAKFEANQIIQKLPEATTDEVVNKIFSPQGASNIRLIKETVAPEVFQEIQNNAMNKILARAIDFDGMTRQADIAKIFNPDALENILRSYGDETLDAMFGREVAQGLKNYQKALDVMTRGEVGRGGAAGTLVAAAIAINAYNPAVWGTILGLTALRQMFQTPFVLKAMARTDKSAVVQVAEFLTRALGFSAVQPIGNTLYDSYYQIDEGIKSALERTDLDEQIIERAGEEIQRAQEIQRDITVPSTAVIEYPEIEPVTIGQGSLSDDPAVRAAILTGQPNV